MIVEFMKSVCSFLCLERDVVHNLFFFYSFSDSCSADSFFTILQQNYRFHPSWFAVLFFLILKHFSFQKRRVFSTFRSPPGFLPNPGLAPVIYVHLVVSKTDLHSRTAPGRNFRLKSSASLGLLSFRVWYILSRNVLSFRRGTSGASKPLQGWRGLLRELVVNTCKIDGWNQHLHLLFQQCHFQVRSTLGG